MRSICNLKVYSGKCKNKLTHHISNEKRQRCFSGYGKREYQNFAKQNSKKPVAFDSYYKKTTNVQYKFPSNCEDWIPSYEDIKVNEKQNDKLDYHRLKLHMENQYSKMSKNSNQTTHKIEITIQEKVHTKTKTSIFCVQPYIGTIDQLGRFELNFSIQKQEEVKSQEFIKRLEKAYQVSLDTVIKISLSEYSRIKRADEHWQNAYEVLRINALLEAHKKTPSISFNQYSYIM